MIENRRITPLRDPVVERLALPKLQGNEMPPFMLVNVVDSADVGMIQGRSYTCFPLETLQRMAVSGDSFWQELQGHETAELGVSIPPPLASR